MPKERDILLLRLIKDNLCKQTEHISPPEPDNFTFFQGLYRDNIGVIAYISDYYRLKIELQDRSKTTNYVLLELWIDIYPNDSKIEIIKDYSKDQKLTEEVIDKLVELLNELYPNYEVWIISSDDFDDEFDFLDEDLEKVEKIIL